MKPIYIARHIIDRDPAVKAYFKEISKFPLLTPVQEFEIAQKVLQGDAKAKEQLINSNLRFVISIASQYPKGSLELLDLISEGNIGLIHAAENFDPTRGFRFLSYAVFWIRQAIMSAINSKARLVRIPEGKIQSMREVFSFIAEYEQKNERQPSFAEIESAIDIPIPVIKAIFGADSIPLSTSSPVENTKPDFTLEDMLQSDTPAPDCYDDHVSVHFELRRILAKILNERELTYLLEFYGVGSMPHSLEEIAKREGVCKERVRQIVDIALHKIHHSTHCKTLRDFL